jgi:hypothetical protein
LCPIVRYYPRICIDGTEEKGGNISQYIWSLGRDSNPEPSDYEPGVLTAR